MTKPDSPEDFTPQEKEQRLIESLRSKGPLNSETYKLLEEWTMDREKEADKINTNKANIELNVRRAGLYRAAGYYENALENLISARLQAFQENEYELLKEIEGEITKVEEEAED